MTKGAKSFVVRFVVRLVISAFVQVGVSPEVVFARNASPAGLVGLQPKPTAEEGHGCHYGFGKSVADGDAI